MKRLRLNTVIPVVENIEGISHINLDLPQTWSDLNDDQLRYILRLRNIESVTPMEIRLLAVLKFAGLEERKPRTDIEREYAESNNVRYFKVARCSESRVKEMPLPDWFLTESIKRMAWLDEPTDDVTRIVNLISGHLPYEADLSDMPFGIYLQVENAWQTALSWAAAMSEQKANKDAQKHLHECLDELASLLYYPHREWYHTFKPRKVSYPPETAQNIMHWMIGWHKYALYAFPHLFRRSGGSSSPITSEALREQTDAQLSALTGGDVTKLPIVLKSTMTHDALHVLDIKANEAAEARKAREEALANAKRR